jgi:hypothetical protein
LLSRTFYRKEIVVTPAQEPSAHWLDFYAPQDNILWFLLSGSALTRANLELDLSSAGDPMAALVSILRPRSLDILPRRSIALVLSAVWLVTALHAKDAPLTAIELYDGPSGPAYVQITDILINGKTELRSCGSAAKIDKSGYGKLPKVALTVGTSVEYGTDGVLTVTRDASSFCVVPSNVRLDGPMTPAELARRVVLHGRVVFAAGGWIDSPPALRPGVKLVFVISADTELAEYLLAERASTTASWQKYLSKYPDSPTHVGFAKQSLASLIAKDGQNSLDSYRKSASAGSRAYEDLKSAKAQADQALAVIPRFASAAKLNEDVSAEIAKIVSQGRAELQAYQQALKDRTPGYVHLVTARNLAQPIAEIDPHSAEVVSFLGEINEARSPLDSNLDLAESMLAAKRFDDAITAITPYRAFASEEPRIAAIVNSAYAFHLQQGRAFAASADWTGATKEFRKASAVSETAEASSALKNALNEAEGVRSKTAVEAALQQSAYFSQQNDFIQAYEILANLSPAQRPLVADEMARLAPSYVKSASQTALGIQKAHDPIRGVADEKEIERAYGYFQRAFALTNDSKLKDRMDDVGDKLSDYYLQEAKRYLSRPLGSRAGMGWWYLQKALVYKGVNLDAVRDEITKARLAYQMRSQLSMRVEFRDQTSRRDSAGFADQLANAIATGLETPDLPIKVIRPGETPPVEPNFTLIGDVLEHRPTKSTKTEAKESNYRAGEQNTPNEKWNKANRDYEAANLELQSAQSGLSGVTARGKKKDIAVAQQKVSDAQKKVEAAHVSRDSIPQTVSRDVIKPYTYSQKTIVLGALVQLQFRVTDSSANPVQGTVPVSRDDSRKFIVLENVKPEDTEGIKVQGTIPDDLELLTDVENQARDALIKAVKDSIAAFPGKIFQNAGKLAEDGNSEAAAESYILYLNSTPAVQSPERQRAEQFLQEKYNIGGTLSSSL